MKEIILDKPWMFTFEKENNDYYLSVLCGTVVMFEIKIKLNEEEKNNYLLSGETYIVELVESIKNSPNNWMSRNING